MEGNWQPGPIATLIDLVAAAAIMSREDTIKVTVDLDISFFSPAKIGVCISHPALYITWGIIVIIIIIYQSTGLQEWPFVSLGIAGAETLMNCCINRIEMSFSYLT